MDFSHLYSTHTFQQTAGTLVWEQQTSPFDDLIVSWNILRPGRGSYHISIGVHAGEWSEWIPYAEWGANRQRTFESNGVVAKCYQDTVMVHDKTADAFRVKLEASSGAPLTINALFASASHLKLFQERLIPALPAVSLPLRQIRSQMRLDHPRHRSLCSPTSLSMAIDWLYCDRLSCANLEGHHSDPSSDDPSSAVLRQYGPPHDHPNLGHSETLQNSHNLTGRSIAKRQRTNPIDLAEKVRDQHFDIYGNWVLNIAESYHRLGRRFACRAERLRDFAALHEQLMRGLPVVVSIKGPLHGAPGPYAEGHLILVRGWDPNGQRILCADPGFASDQDVLTSYDGQDFLKAWGRRFNLAYTFTPQEE